MNLDRHVSAFRESLSSDLVNERTEKAERDAQLLPRSISPWPICPPSSTWRRCSTCSRITRCRAASSVARPRVDPAAIRRTALLTIEGERDDICSLGQTLAAHDLCSGLRRT